MARRKPPSSRGPFPQVREGYEKDKVEIILSEDEKQAVMKFIE